MKLAILCVLLGSPLQEGDRVETRYVRVSPKGKASECAFSVRRSEKGWEIESVTGRGKSTLTVTARFDSSDTLLEAEAVLGTGEERKAALVGVVAGKASVQREGQDPQAFEVPAGVIVTSAPDWTDTFLICRRYDRAKAGKQEFPGLWIHPVQPAQRPTFTAEKTGGATVEQGGQKIEVDRLAIRLRGGSAYVAWADPKGRLLKLVSLPYKEGTAELVLEGFEDATAGLKPE